MIPTFMGDAIFQRRESIRSREAPKPAAPQTALTAPRGIVPTEPSSLHDDRVSGRTRRTRRFWRFEGERRSRRHGGEVKAQWRLRKRGQTQRWKSQHLLGRSTNQPLAWASAMAWWIECTLRIT